MILSNLLPLLLLTGRSVGASPASTAKPAEVNRAAAAAQTPNTMGNLLTGVTDANGQSPSPSPAGNEAVATGSPAATPAETAPSAATDASGNSNPLGKPALGGILGGASQVSDAAQQATQAASAAAGQSPGAGPVPPGSGDPLGGLSGYLNGATGLLSPSLMPDLEEVIHDAAYILRGPTTKNTKALLDSAHELINPDTVAKIISAVHVAQSIITPEAIAELEKVDLAQVLADIGYLWTKGKSVLSSVQGLFSEQYIQEIRDIIDSVTSFLAQGSTKDLEEILHKLEGVLPPEVTSSLQTLLSSIGPIVNQTMPIINDIESYMSQVNYKRLGTVAYNMGQLIDALAIVVTPQNIKMAEDALHKAEPYFTQVEDYLSHLNWNQLGGLMDNVESLVSAMASALTPENIKMIEGYFEQAKPYIEDVFDYLAHANWTRVGHLVYNMLDLMSAVAGFLTPKRIEEGKNAFNYVAGYFTQANMAKARNLASSLWSKLSPGAINRASILMGNAELLLGAVAPLVMPDSLDHAKKLYAEAESYFPPDFVHRLKEASNKLGILYDSIAPGITTPTMNKLGGLVDTVIGLLTPQFANETSSLIGTASGVLTPHLVSEVDDWVHYVENMFTPDVRNDTKRAIGSAADVSWPLRLLSLQYSPANTPLRPDHAPCFFVYSSTVS